MMTIENSKSPCCGHPLRNICCARKRLLLMLLLLCFVGCFAESNQKTSGERFNWLHPSLFPNVPPTLRFWTFGSTKLQTIDPSIQKYLRWNPSPKHLIHHEHINSIISNSGYSLTNSNRQPWFGHWNSKAFSKSKSIPSQKHNRMHVRGLPSLLGNKVAQFNNLKSFLRHHRKFAATNSNAMEAMVLRSYELPKQLDEAKSNFKSADSWILKGETGHASLDVHFVSDWTDVQDVLKAVDGRRYLLQKFVTDPLLVDGRKVELRIYVLITSLSPLRAYLSYNGNMKLAGTAGAGAGECMKILAHPSCLTNRTGDILLHHNDSISIVKSRHDNIVYSGAYLSHTKLNATPLKSRIERLVKLSLLSIQDKGTLSILKTQHNNYNSFSLLSFDFLVDGRGQAWLIEVNTSPETCLKRNPRVLSEVLNLVGYHIGPNVPKKIQNVVRNELNTSSVIFEPKLYSFPTHHTRTIISQQRSQGERDWKHLTPDDVRQLIIAEDELVRAQQYTNFIPIFPFTRIGPYRPYLKKPVDFVSRINLHYHVLFSVWGKKKAQNQDEGMEILRQYALKNVHLI